MPREKIGREELYGHTTEKQQKAIKTLHSAPEIEYSLKKKKEMPRLWKQKVFCLCTSGYFVFYLPTFYLGKTAYTNAEIRTKGS